MLESATDYERLLRDCERMAIEVFGARAVVLLDQSAGRPAASHRAYLQMRGERVSHDPSRLGECYAGSPADAIAHLLALLNERASA